MVKLEEGAPVKYAIVLQPIATMKTILNPFNLLNSVKVAIYFYINNIKNVILLLNNHNIYGKY